MNYFTQKNANGTLNISSFVFIQSAKKALDDLLEDELKDVIFLKSGKKTCKITCDIDKKNKIVLTAEVFIAADKNANEATAKIQKEIFDAIYDATEISNVKVNVIVLGFVIKK